MKLFQSIKNAYEAGKKEKKPPVTATLDPAGHYGDEEFGKWADDDIVLFSSSIDSINRIMENITDMHNFKLYAGALGKQATYLKEDSARGLEEYKLFSLSDNLAPAAEEYRLYVDQLNKAANLLALGALIKRYKEVEKASKLLMEASVHLDRFRVLYGRLMPSK
jgi:hypothetical protein